MKKFLIIATAIACTFCIFLCGCKKGKDNTEEIQREVAETVRRPFTTTADIRYGELVAKAEMLSESSGFKLEFTEPSALKGMMLRLEEDIITIKYKEVETEMTVDEFYSSSVVKMIVAAINKAASESGISIEMGKSTITVNGTSESGNFCLILDRENGNMLSLSVPQSELSVDFYGFSFTD